MKNQLITFLLILISIHSSAQKSKDISGLYDNRKSILYECEQIYLNKNGNFEYYINSDLGGSNIFKGSWYFISDTLYLSTFNKPRQLYSFIINSHKENNDSILILVYKNDSIPLSTSILVNNSFKKKSDINGKVYFSAQIIECVDLFFLNQSYHFEFKPVVDKDLTLFIPIIKSQVPEYLMNDKWLYKNKMLFPYGRADNKYDKKYSLKKMKLINKKF
jgi:hypothetical protein